MYLYSFINTASVTISRYIIITRNKKSNINSRMTFIIIYPTDTYCRFYIFGNNNGVYFIVSITKRFFSTIQYACDIVFRIIFINNFARKPPCPNNIGCNIAVKRN
ncbi:hypothetical protein Barb7_01933 [Bacteroidales bacterium Barb7]|nr:hypothetical protein Barb7_01933 [Bacteroidales bacterium Barb7]